MSFTLNGKQKLLIAGVLLGFLFYASVGSKFLGNQPEQSTQPQQTDNDMVELDAELPPSNLKQPLQFSSIQSVKPSDLVEWLPQLTNQPAMIAFKSKYCHDCQEMAPILEALSAEHPEIAYIPIDVQRDKTTYGPVIKGFLPSVVPIVVFIQKGGRVQHSLTGYQTAEAIAPHLQKLSSH